MSASVIRPTLLGVPFDGESSFARGPALAPATVRAAYASPSTNTWSEGGVDLEPILEDAGDVDCRGDHAVVRDRISTRVAALVTEGRRPIAIGGDHSVSFPLVRGLAPLTDVTLIHVDAHPDLYPDFEGNLHSHACPFARIMEAGLVRRLVQVGIRTMSGVQRANAERHGVEVIDMPAWVRGARPEVNGPIYLSIDIDGLDPAFAPGVSHPEPGGLTTREVITLIQSLGGPLIAADVVELNPTFDVRDLTARVAAKVVKEIAAKMLQG
jgi:arginase